MRPDTAPPTYRYAEARIKILRARAVAAIMALDFRRAAELEWEAFGEERKLARQRAAQN
jgi:hypothetical protein